jgi:hypothetical protein
MNTAPISEARLYTALKYASALTVLALVALFFISSPWLTSGGNKTSLPAPTTPKEAVSFAWQGVASCSAMPCHHQGPSARKPGNEFGIWFEQDPHARAYEVLTDDISRNISRRLRRKSEPDRDDLCLRCHVDPKWEEASKDPNFSLSDGVGCESCHGPAQSWLTNHYREGLTPTDRRRGMHDTRSLSNRVRICLDCHVGGSGQDVDHDLIAAGHPALRFEFGAYHALLPRHWDDRKDRDPERDPRGRRDFEARAWALGQVAAGQAALRLLAARASAPADRRPWPELAEYDCFSCHHDLQAPSWRQKRASASAGIPLWGDWYFSSFEVAVTARTGGSDVRAREMDRQVEELRKHLESWNPPRPTVASRAARLADDLERELTAAENAGRYPIEALARQLVEQGNGTAARSWDSATQSYLGLTALNQAWRDLHSGRPSPLDASLIELRRVLEFPGANRSPSRYAPAEVQQMLKRLKIY